MNLALEVVFIMYSINLLCSGTYIAIKKKYEQFNIFNSQALLMVLWGVFIALTYFLLVFYKHDLSVSLLMMMRAFAPVLAVYLIKEDRESIQYSFNKKISFLILFMIIGINFFTATNNFSLESLWANLLLLIIALASQILGRKSKSLLPSQVISYISIGVLISVLLWFVASSVSTLELVTMLNLKVFLSGIFLGLGVMIVQILFVKGINNTEPLLSSLCLALSVPVALICDSFLREHVNKILVFLSFIYLIPLMLEFVKKNERVRYKSN